MKRILVLFFLTTFLFVGTAGHGFSQEEHGVGLTSLTAEDTSKLAIAQSLGIHVFRMENLSRQEETDIAHAIYDTEIFTDARYTRDEEPRSSVFAGTLSEEILIEAGLKKELPMGTEVEVSWLSDRDETDTIFVSVNPVYNTRAQVTIKQPLLKNAFGFIDRKRLEQVEIDVKRFNFQTLKKIEDFVFETRRVFWRARAAYQVLAIQKKGLKDAWLFYKITQEKVKLGLLENPDLLASKANLKRREIQILVAANAAKDRENALKTLLSLPLEGRLRLESATRPEPPEADYDSLLQHGLAFRYDKRQALLEAKLQGLSVKITQSDLWPEVDLEATGAISGLDREYREASREAWDTEFPTYSVGLVVDFPLENRDARGKHNQAKLDHRRVLLEIEQLDENIQKEVDAAYRGTWTDYARFQLANEIVELERRKLKEEMGRFYQGRSSADLIVDYQTDYLVAQDFRAKVIADYGIALDERARASGHLLQAYVSGEEGL